MQFDLEQRDAINYDGRRLLVLAGAGTGKTTMMLGRIRRLISIGATPESIIALTFTNAAACEMESRFMESAGSYGAPTFATFHAFCYRMIISDKDVMSAIGYKSDPSVATESDEKQLRTMCKLKLGTKLPDAKLDGVKPLGTKDRFAFDVFWKQYQKMLRDKGLITFDMMCKEVCALFTKNHPAVHKYQSRYKYIFVDEFQDTDQIQWGFVRSFSDAYVTVVGDAKQNLYRFRGCTNDIVKELSQSDQWHTIKLHNNHRSTAQICDFSNKIHASWGDAAYNLLIRSDTDGAAVRVRTDGLHISCDLQSATDAVEVASGAYNGESTAILCRTNTEVSEVSDWLARNKIQHTKSTVSLLRRNILQSAIDDSHFLSWMPTNLSAHDYAEWIKAILSDPAMHTVESFAKLYGGHLSSTISDIGKIRAIVSSDMSNWQKFDQICETLSIGRSYTQRYSSFDTLNDVLNTCLHLCDIQPKSSTVYVGTIHSSKGLEYDNVHVVGVNGSTFKLNNEDNLNCYYVACTRAKKQLTVWIGDLQ